MGRPALSAVSTSSLQGACRKHHQKCQHERAHDRSSWGMAADMAWHALSHPMQTRQSERPQHAGSSS